MFVLSCACAAQGPEGYTEGYPFLEDTEWGQEHAEELKNFALP